VHWSKMSGASWGLDWAPNGEPKTMHFQRKGGDFEVPMCAGAK